MDAVDEQGAPSLGLEQVEEAVLAAPPEQLGAGGIQTI